MSEANGPLVTVEDLVIRFPIGGPTKRQFITPVDHVTFHIGRGEVLSLVGESGSGKTTIGRALMRILEPTSGRIVIGGNDVTHARGRGLIGLRNEAQMVFQDPFGSLNPARTVEQQLTFPVRRHLGLTGQKLYSRVGELLSTVGLTPVEETRIKYPHELSGGQRQRVAIARALAVNPKFLVADEPISMLDVSIRAGILKLMNQLKAELNLSYLYITHDLASARYFGDRIMVMYGGQIMESGASSEIVANPQHPYTQVLLAATPGNPSRVRLAETTVEAPDLSEGRRGCPFAQRCPIVSAICRTERPDLKKVNQVHDVACHHRG